MEHRLPTTERLICAAEDDELLIIDVDRGSVLNAIWSTLSTTSDGNELLKIQQEREKELLKIQQERDELLKIQQEREKELFKIQQERK